MPSARTGAASTTATSPGWIVRNRSPVPQYSRPIRASRRLGPLAIGHSDNPAPAVDQRGSYDRAYRQGSPTWTDNRQSGDRSNWQQRRGTWNGSTDQYRQREARQYQQQRVRDGSRWASGGWNREWRNDRRYDWRNYRDRHRSVFRLGIYYDPFGYGYRSFDIGYRLQPNYYGQQLLDRSGAVRPALPAARHELGALLERRPAGRHVQWRSGRRDPQFLLVETQG